jgi:hypothetical protein
MKIKSILKLIWEWPQNLVGWIVKKASRATYYTTYKDATIYSWNIDGGISLGSYIFVPYKESDPDSYRVQQYIKHEYGHTRQSKYLGWFYLLVIGLPSLIWSQCYMDYWSSEGRSYYDFYTESWANKLGGVDSE